MSFHLRVLSIEVTEYTFLLHDVITICGKHIISYYTHSNFMLPIDTTPIAKVLLTCNYLNLIISGIESRVEVL